MTPHFYSFKKIRGQLARIGKILTLGIAAILTVMTTGQTMANEINKQSVQTFCAGRLLIDLPATARVTSRQQRFQGHIIYTIPNVTLEQYQANIQKRIAEWQADITPFRGGKYPAFANAARLGSVANAVMLTKWKRPEDKKYLIPESYYWINGTEIISKEDSELLSEDLPEVVTKLEKLFPRIQHLNAGEIPEGPGFCMDGAWIPQDGSDPYDWEMMDFQFELASNPDVQFWLRSNTIKNSEPILTRNDKNEFNKEVESHVDYLRKGDKNIAPFKGQELDMRFRELNGSVNHSLNWESIPAKSSNALDPLVALEAKTGYSPNQTAPINSSLTNDELLKVWDSILNTIRLRPTGPAPVKASEAPPKANLGAAVETDGICPQNGLWQPAAGGALRFVREGDRMPNARVDVKLGLVQKLKGARDYDYVPTVWTLRQYTDRDGKPLA